MLKWCALYALTAFSFAITICFSNFSAVRCSFVILLDLQDEVVVAVTIRTMMDNIFNFMNAFKKQH